MNWFTQFFKRRRIFSDLSEEIQQHLAEKTEALIDEGMSRGDAEQAARRNKQSSEASPYRGLTIR